MKHKIQGYVLLFLIIFLCTSGLFSKVTDFFVWLVTLHYNTASISAWSEIFVKITTFIVSYGLVGIIYDSIGFHDKKIMSLSYYIISTILSFVLCYIIMLIETHILVIAIVLLCLLVLMIGIIVTFNIIEHNKKKNAEEAKENK